MDKEECIAWTIPLFCLVLYIPVYITICTEASVLTLCYYCTMSLSFAGKAGGAKEKGELG